MTSERSLSDTEIRHSWMGYEDDEWCRGCEMPRAVFDAAPIDAKPGCTQPTLWPEASA